MRWPFKKYPPKAELKIPVSWSVRQGEYNGRPLVTRFNVGLRDIAGHPEYEHQVGVAVPLRASTSNGPPTAEECEALTAIEEELTRSLEADRQSLFVGVISTSGMREFVFYTSDWEGAKSRIEALQQDVAPHQLQIMVKKDPGWSTYAQFV